MPQSQASTLISVESLINSHDTRLSSLQKELKVHRQMLNNLLENDEEFTKLSEQTSKLTKQKTLAKQKVLHTPNATTLVEKLKDIQSQVKELKVALSDYLAQYVNIAGTNQFEGADGVIRQIIYTARLIKKKD